MTCNKTNAKQIMREYEREKEWATSVVTIGESMDSCLVCGEVITESMDRHGLTVRCPNGHELILRDRHMNN